MSDAHCKRCGDDWPIEALDSRPRITWWLWIVRHFRGQPFMLQYAADHGYDFDELYCVECYGPGYTP